MLYLWVVTAKRSGLNLEFILYGSGVFRGGIEGFFSEGNKIVLVNKYECGRASPVGGACNEDGREDSFPLQAHPRIRELIISRDGAVQEHLK